MNKSKLIEEIERQEVLPITKQSAKDFLRKFSENIPPPDVSKMKDGSICFMWNGKDESVLIARITPGRRLIYAMDASDGIKKCDDLFIEDALATDIEYCLMGHVFKDEDNE